MELKTLPKVPLSMGAISDRELDRLSRTSTVRLPTPPVKGCDTCKGKKTFQSWDKEGKDVVQYRCDCEGQYLLSLELLRRGIDHEYQRLDWYDVVAVPGGALDTVSDYISNAERYVDRGLGLTLYGDPGTGKSLVLHLLAKALVCKGVDVYAIQHNHMLELYKDGWRDPDEKAHFKKCAFRSKVLVWDDFDVPRPGHDHDMVDQVLRTRAANGLVTLISTNLSMEAMEPGNPNLALDRRVRSLLTKINDPVEFRGEDFRPQQRERVRKEALMDIRRPVVA